MHWYDWVFLGLRILAIIFAYGLMQTIIEKAQIRWEKGVKIIAVVIALLLGWRFLLICAIWSIMLSLAEDNTKIRNYFNKDAKW